MRPFQYRLRTLARAIVMIALALSTAIQTVRLQRLRVQVEADRAALAAERQSAIRVLCAADLQLAAAQARPPAPAGTNP